jgi:hypothetical protein
MSRPLIAKDTCYLFGEKNIVLAITKDSATFKKATEYFTDFPDSNFYSISPIANSTDIIVKNNELYMYRYRKNAAPVEVKYIKYCEDNAVKKIGHEYNNYLNCTIFPFVDSDVWLSTLDTSYLNRKFAYVCRLSNDTVEVRKTVEVRESVQFRSVDPPILEKDDDNNIWIAYSDTLMILKSDGSVEGIDIESLPLNTTQNSYFICSMTKYKDGVAFATNVGDIYLYNKNTRTWRLDMTYNKDIDDIDCRSNYPMLVSNAKGELYFSLTKDYNKIFKLAEDNKWTHIDVPYLPLENDFFIYNIFFNREDKMVIVSPYNVAIEQ